MYEIKAQRRCCEINFFYKLLPRGFIKKKKKT